MAAKKTPDAARLKALEMREAQAKADRRTKAIIVSVVVVVVLAVVATVGIVIAKQVREKDAAMTADPATTLGQYADGSPVLYSHLGVGQLDESLPTLTEYFDYTCHACADIDVLIGESVSEGATAGEYNLVLQPVTTVGMAYASPATTAALVVAQKDPEHFIAFHHALLAYFASQYNSGKGQVIQDEEKSWEQVKTIASEVGVPAKVVDSFPLNAVTDYLATSTQAWNDAAVSGRDRLGTPEFVNDAQEHISLSGNDAASVLASVRTGMGLAATMDAIDDAAQSK